MSSNVLAWSVQALLIVAAAALTPAALRVRSPRAQLILLQAVLFGLLALPAAQPWHRPTIAAPVFVADVETATPVEPIATDARRARFDWNEALLYTLGAGILLRIAWLGLGLLRLQRYRRNAEPLPGRRCFAISREVTSPVTFGLVRPVVLVPPAFLQLPPEQQDAIAAHELLHIQRRDWLFCIAEEIAASVMWFHPAVWYLVARIRVLREQVVDAEALARTKAREPYVEALLAMAETRPMLDVAAAPLFLRKRDLTHRVKTILEDRLMSKRRIAWSYACVAALVSAAAVYGALHFPLTGAPLQSTSESKGRLTRVDAYSLPQPLRSQVESRLAPYLNAPFSTDDMMRLRSDVAAIDSKIVQQWVQESQDSYAVSFSYPPDAPRTEPLLVHIDASRLPEPLRSQAEARVRSYLNAPFTDALIGSVQSAVGILDRGIALRWRNDGGGNMALILDYAPAGNDPQTVHGVLAQIDVSRLAEPLRSRLDARLAKYRNAPYTNAMMRDLSRDAFAEEPKVFLRWQVERPGVFSVTLSTDPPSPAADTPQAPAAQTGARFPSDGGMQIRVGGAVQAAKLKYAPKPLYPALAQQARIQGVVRFDVQIGRDGRVSHMQLVSGHPLLVPAAVDVLKQYEYEPTLLNGQPVQVVTVVDVNFTLN